jgi:hypothetical protein
MTAARDPARRSHPAPVTRPGTPLSRFGKAGRKSRTGPLPAKARRIPVPQPHHHGTQAAQAIAIQDQASPRASRIRAERIGRIRRYQAWQPVGQLHLQMRHPVHVPQRVGPQPGPMQRMRHRGDHNLARQLGTETS